MTSKNVILRCFVLGVALAVTSAADAADIPAKSPAKIVAPAPVDAWSFRITPYFWAAGLTGDVKLGPAAPLTHVDASFWDVLSNLKFAAMATLEARKERYGLVADIIYLSLATTATGPLGFVNARFKNKTFMTTINAAYRVVDNGPWWLDLEAGARIWAMNFNLGFQLVPVGFSTSYSLSKSWIDPVIGVRAHANLGQGFFVQGYADVGGFDVSSQSTWQVAGLLGYEYSPKVSLLAGYRYLSVDYRHNGFVFDVDMSGPILGVTFKLN